MLVMLAACVMCNEALCPTVHSYTGQSEETSCTVITLRKGERETTAESHLGLSYDAITAAACSTHRDSSSGGDHRLSKVQSQAADQMTILAIEANTAKVTS